MSSFAVGRQAETVAADYLQQQSFVVLHKNWRTRYCEIDIVARKNEVVYFVEVKHRRTSSHGDGFAYITAAKLRQMQFAAQFWVARHNWLGDYQLVVIAVEGKDFSRLNLRFV